MGILSYIKEQERNKRNLARNEILKNYYDDLELSNSYKKILEVIKKSNTASFLDMQKYDSKDMYPLISKLDFDKTKSLALAFFGDINPDFANYFKMRMYDQSGIKMGTNPRTNVETREVEITNYGDLRDLYAIVHEFSHLFDSRKSDSKTRNILTETTAQCMERLLDSYLINLNDDELLKYGLDIEHIKEDIIARKISTFFKRNASLNNINLNVDPTIKAESSGYLLAQIYSNSFSNLDFQTQKLILNNLIKNINKDSFEEAIKILPVDLSKNNKHRNIIIHDMISGIVDLNYSNVLDKNNNIKK